jgi:hypothetical protein
MDTLPSITNTSTHEKKNYSKISSHSSIRLLSYMLSNQRKTALYQNSDLFHFFRESEDNCMGDQNINDMTDERIHTQLFCPDGQNVDWDDLKSKLAFPHSPDAIQEIRTLLSEVMNKQKSRRRNNSSYQMGRDELHDPGDLKVPDQNIKLQRPEMISTEGDYLFSDDLTNKPKYRLLLNPAMRQKLEWEFPRYKHDLEITIQMKFQSLGIPVEVKAYTRLDRHRTRDKTFTVTFQSSVYERAALQLIEQGRLDVRMNEARPSPSYHVKFIVLCRVGVYEGKCFRRRFGELKKGDIVTANQERGNKVRIIIRCPRGSNIQHELKGWILLRTKDKELLRRIELVQGEIVEKGSRVFASKKPASENISPKCMPLRALNQVQVYSGNEEPSNRVIDQLNPGTVVCGDKLLGSMLRIIKLDACGDIQLGYNAEPQPYGWVMLRRYEDDQPQFAFFPRIFNYVQGNFNTGEHLNQFYRTSIEEIRHEVEKQFFFDITEELSNRNPSLSYNDHMSMVSSSVASNLVSPPRTVHTGALYIGDTFGSMRSNGDRPPTTSSNEHNWLHLRDMQAQRIKDCLSLPGEAFLD